jgi:hypothetical protein
MSEIEDHYDHDVDDDASARGALPARLPGAAGEPPRANPDDPPVQRPPQGPRGPLPGPRMPGAPGRIAIVQSQVFLVAVIMIVQLWLVTDALFQLLSGRPQELWGLTISSGVGFVLALFVALWPLRRVRGL